MGRPNLTKVRRAEILDAFERCVADYGLEGSSAERIAQEAGMKRSILRHYVGNREELIHALADRVVEKYRTGMEEYLRSTAEETPLDQLMGLLFPDQPIGTPETLMACEALIGSADKYPRVRKLMTSYVDDLVVASARLLRSAFPEAGHARCWAVAYGVVGLCFNQESLRPLQLPPRYPKAVRTCVDTLIESLSS